MTKVLIIDANKQPLYPVRISYARKLLSQGKAIVYQRYPFTIILTESLSQTKLEQLGFKPNSRVKITNNVVTKGRRIDINIGRVTVARKINDEPKHLGTTT